VCDGGGLFVPAGVHLSDGAAFSGGVCVRVCCCGHVWGYGGGRECV